MIKKLIPTALTLALGVTGAVVPVTAHAATGYTVHNSAHSDWNIGAWSDGNCGGTIHLIAPGHKRGGVKSIKAYGEHNVLIKPSGARSTMIKRHCYTVRGNHWKVKSQGD